MAVFLGMLRPIAWVVLVSLVALSSRTIRNDWPLLPCLWIALMVASGMWALKQPWIMQAKRPLERQLGIVFSVILAPIVVFATALVSGELLEKLSVARYEAARAAFMEDPQGFPFIKQFAREHYGVHVVLANATSDWNANTVALPHSITAGMRTAPGYCELHINVVNVRDRFAGSDPQSRIKGVLAHELAHCLDSSRDLPTFASDGVGTRSLAPSDAAQVTTLEEYLESEARLPTKRWREALADIFAVGFWRLTDLHAAQLVADLRDRRTAGDAAHATTCWIDQAVVAPMPTSMQTLLSWADAIRAAAPCKP